MSSRRRRRGRGATVAVASVLAVGVAATAGVVWFLNDAEPPVTPRCAAELDGTRWYLSPTQAENAALVVGTTVQRGLPGRAATIGLATALQESRLVNIDYGDRDSVGLFQQRPSQGWGTVDEIMDPVYSTGKFYDGLVEVDGYQDLEVTVAAQAVQRSGFPDAYAQHETRSRAWASALTGHTPGSVTCTLPASDDTALSDDPAPTGDAARELVVERAARDLGLPADAVTAGDDPTRLVVDATALPLDDTDRATWALAHWAVATAATTGAVEVRAGDRVWTREDGSWHDDDTRHEADGEPEGRVVVGLVASG